MLVLSGLVWVSSGVVMGKAPKEGLDAGCIITLETLVAVPFVLLALLLSGFPTCTLTQMWAIAAISFACGFVNYLQLVDMSTAMQCGPNGIIWSIIQCGFIIPFLIGVIFFHTPIYAIRIAGVVALLISLNLMGFLGDKGHSAKVSGNWKLPTFRGFIWTGLTQTFVGLPSYFGFIDDIGVLWRILWASIGLISSSVVLMSCSGKLSTTFRKYKEQFRIKKVWFYALFLKALGLSENAFLELPGIDILARHNAGAITMPLMVGSCIIGFELYAIAFLHEKRSFLQYIALLMCLFGTVAICL